MLFQFMVSSDDEAGDAPDLAARYRNASIDPSRERQADANKTPRPVRGPSGASFVLPMGLGRVELPTSRLSGSYRQSPKSGKMAEILDSPRDLSGRLGVEYGRKPV
jgi:hypothetical protein